MEEWGGVKYTKIGALSIQILSLLRLPFLLPLRAALLVCVGN